MRPGDARVGSALAAAPVPDGHGGVRTVGAALAAAAQRGHTTVSDADYQCLSTDVQVGMVSLTAARTVSLPDVDTFPLGQDLVIADESGACSESLTITIIPGSGTGDTIAGDGSIVLTSPYQAVRFRRGAANLWIRL
ncbi:hypothetical protein HNR01_001799 [Methylorubrum rhodesianum]|nr:hypothetical protein [Methylorubrum rhodesianum]